MNLTNNCELFVRSRAMFFRVCAVFTTDEQEAANRFLDEHSNTAVLTVDESRIYIVDMRSYSGVLQSAVIDPHLIQPLKKDHT